MALTASLFFNALFVNKSYAAEVANPILSPMCGLDIALVVDVSGSIDQNEFDNMKTALTCYVLALSTTPVPTYFSLSVFSSEYQGSPAAAVVLPLTKNSGADTQKIINAINGMPKINMGTNWAAGIATGRSTYNADPRPDIPNMMIFMTDDNPNAPGPNNAPVCGNNGTVVENCPEALAAAILEANTTKSQGIRILAFGVGDQYQVINLTKIAGPIQNDINVTKSDVITGSFTDIKADMGSRLKEFANAQCEGGIRQVDVCGTKKDGICGKIINICNSGYFRDLEDTTCAENWECFGLYGGSRYTCSITKTPINGVCGKTAGLCLSGTYSDSPGDTAKEKRWTCLGEVCGKNSSICTAAIATEAPKDCGDWCRLIRFLRKFFQYMLYFVAPLALLMVVWGGIIYITSNGDEEKTRKGKRIIMYALIGVVIVTGIFGMITLTASLIK